MDRHRQVLLAGIPTPVSAPPGYEFAQKFYAYSDVSAGTITMPADLVSAYMLDAVGHSGGIPSAAEAVLNDHGSGGAGGGAFARSLAKRLKNIGAGDVLPATIGQNRTSTVSSALTDKTGQVVISADYGRNCSAASGGLPGLKENCIGDIVRSGGRGGDAASGGGGRGGGGGGGAGWIGGNGEDGATTASSGGGLGGRGGGKAGGVGGVSGVSDGGPGVAGDTFADALHGPGSGGGGAAATGASTTNPGAGGQLGGAPGGLSCRTAGVGGTIPSSSAGGLHLTYLRLIP